ncbi:HdeD family acid-resistance protein [Pseudonocardia sp. H11422]|uniref:HdeD family acid-resistance protein n=1 Tax=Pseudonocardia sp. H11422 TaxID=2835866 RepID=UPI002027CE7D|nr:DUF308 domain-containing protein [Pseudonocardia sp. H11422]
MSARAGSTGNDRVAGTARRVGGSRGWAIALGALTIVAGLLVLIWPRQTVAVLAVILGLELIVVGIFRIVAAFSLQGVSGGARALVMALGVLAVVVGILVLLRPLQTAALVAVLVGLFWVISGIVDIVRAVTGTVPSRGWAFVMGAFTLFAGVIVLAFPLAGAVVFAWVFGVLLLVWGVLITAAAVIGGQSVAHGPVT